MLYAIFKWNFFHPLFACSHLDFFYFKWNSQKKNNSTRMNYLYILYTKFNSLDACLFCYALLFFFVHILRPLHPYEKLAGPLGRAVKRFIIFMLIPNVFNVYKNRKCTRARWLARLLAFPFSSLTQLLLLRRR